MTIECPKCQTDNPDSQKFCGECATPLPGIQDIIHTKTLETPTEELTSGSTFAGRYQFIEELGKGGMGKVYRVLDKKLNEEVALKLIKPDIALDKRTIERFKNELKLARKIRQKNVGSMYELMEEQGTHFITMEYISGQDLKGLIRQTGQLTVGKTISIAKQICEGLAEAHNLGVVHRDLKPSNIMIDRGGNARIMDFGIARAIKEKSITGSGVMIGTPEYMSPEQVEGKEVDQRSDIYSLGIILYEMLTDREPFEGDTPLTVGVKQKSETPKDPKDFNERIPDDFNQLILKCLEKEKENRYQNADELKSELERLEQGLPTAERVEPKKKITASKEITVTIGWKKLLIPAVAVLALSVILILALTNRRPDVVSNRVVVALFENQTGDPNLDNLSKLACDWITHGLAQTGFFSTTPMITVAALTETLSKEDLISGLAGETKARWIITGSYYLQEKNLQFHIRLNDVQNEKNTTSLDPVTGSRENPMEVIESTKQRIMGTMAIKSDPRIAAFTPQTPSTPKYEAYLEYMEGCELFMIRRDYEAAIDHFNKAIAMDPSFVLPMLTIAVGYSNFGRYAESDAALKKANEFRNEISVGERYFLDYSRANRRGDRTEALRLIREAAKFSPLYEYHVGLAAYRMNYPQEGVEAFLSINPEILMWQGWYSYWADLCFGYHMLEKHKKELKAARQGRKQYPDLLSNLWYEIRALAALGKVGDIQKRIEESHNLSLQGSWTPASIMGYASRELRLHGHKKKAIEIANQAIAWYKENKDRDYRSSLAFTLEMAEQWEEAREIYEQLLLENPDNINCKGHLGALAVRLGEREVAIRISEDLSKIEQPYINGNHTYWRACIASVLGEKELAVRLHRESLHQGQSYERLYYDIDLEPLYATKRGT